MNELANVNPFVETLAKLAADWPESFALEVEEHVFKDVGSTEKAFEIQRTMEGMKLGAMAMGYTVTINRNPAVLRWVYSFVRRPDAVRPEAKVAALPPPGQSVY